MSPPSSEPDFADAGFDDGLIGTTESTYPVQPVAPEPVPATRYRKQGFSIYTVMLIMSFVFLLTAMILLFIEAGKY